MRVPEFSLGWLALGLIALIGAVAIMLAKLIR